MKRIFRRFSEIVGLFADVLSIMDILQHQGVKNLPPLGMSFPWWFMPGIGIFFTGLGVWCWIVGDKPLTIQTGWKWWCVWETVTIVLFGMYITIVHPQVLVPIAWFSILAIGLAMCMGVGLLTRTMCESLR